MIVKGIVSSIDVEAKTVTVILPEYNNIVTRPIKVFQDTVSSLKVNDFILVVVFNNDFNDCLVITASASAEYENYEYTEF